MSHFWENLPSGSIDFEWCSVISMTELLEEENYELCPNPLDHVIESGTVEMMQNGNLVTIPWGRTAPNEHGVYEVVVDVPEITLPIIQLLWRTCIIDRPFSFYGRSVADETNPWRVRTRTRREE